jgi:hypothetical protein
MILAVAVYFVPRGLQANPDSHLALTYALVEQHSARIDDYATNLLDQAVYCGPHTDVHSCRHRYTDKAPGISLLAAAIYLPLHLVITPPAPHADRFLLRFLLTLLTISLPCAVFAATYWQFMAGFVGAWPAMLTAVGYGLGSMALPFTTLLFSHALSAALLFWAFMLLNRTNGSTSRRGAAIAAGALAGYAIGCEYPAVLIAALLGVYALLRHGRARPDIALFWWYCLGAAIGLLPAAVYNTIAFGSPFALGYGHLTDPYYAQGMAHGILGVGLPTWQSVWDASFSPYRGLFFLSPWLLLAAPGLVRMARGGLEAEAWLCAIVGVVYFLFEISYAFWDGGASVGPRHFLPALPFLAFPTAFAFQQPALRKLGAILITVSVAAMVLVVGTNPLFGDPRFVRHVGNPLVDQTLHDLTNGQVQNNWGMVLHLAGAASLIPLVVLLLLLARALRKRLEQEAQTAIPITAGP